jgi:hypothetical protein
MRLDDRELWNRLLVRARHRCCRAGAAVAVGLVFLFATATAGERCCKRRCTRACRQVRSVTAYCESPRGESRGGKDGGCQLPTQVRDARTPGTGREAGERRLFDGKSLTGWSVPQEYPFKDHGQVQVRGGRIELAAGSPATGIVRTDKPPRKNYEVSLDAMRTSGNDFFCGLTFPVADEYCSLILGGWGGQVVGLSNVDSMPANENVTTTFTEFEDNKWYRVRLRVTDQRITAWLDDEKVIDLATAGRKFSIWWEQEPMRPLGIATWSTGAALRNIKLRDVPGR